MGTIFNEQASKVMNNSLMMEKIASNLAAAELWTLRATCSLWSAQINPHLGKKGFAHLGSGSVQELTEFMQTTSEFVFENFVLYKLRGCGDDMSLACRDLHNFFASITCRSHVKTLQIMGEAGETLGAAGIKRVVLVGDLPELKFLSITGSRCQTSNSLQRGYSSEPPRPPLAAVLPKLACLKFFGTNLMDSNYYTLICDLLRATTGLTSLILKWEQYRNDLSRYFLPIVAGLGDNLVKLNQLKSLEVSPLREQELRILANLARGDGTNVLRLEAFCTSFRCLNFDDAENCARILREFLSTQGDTLRLLRINFGSEFKYEFHFPLLEHLHSLELSCSCKPLGGLRYDREGQFGSCFPELRALSYDSDMPLFIEADVMDQFAHDLITELKVHTHARTVSILGPRLPSVTRACLTLWSAEITHCSMVLSMWPNLTRLDLEFYLPQEINLDLFLTGVNRKNLETLRGELGQMPRPLKVDALRIALNCHKAETAIPAIVDMMVLRELTIRNRINAFEIPMSDIGIYFGLALAGPCLQQINFSGINTNFDWNQCSGFLRSALGQAGMVNFTDSLGRRILSLD